MENTQHIQYRLALTFGMLGYGMLKHPVNCLPVAQKMHTYRILDISAPLNLCATSEFRFNENEVDV